MADQSAGKILVICRTFLPKEGGIEEYAYNRCLQDPGQVIVLTAAQKGVRTFDTDQPFPIYRWPLPNSPALGIVNSLLKQLINLLASFVMAIQLHQRYRYETIEWGHGYDFPSLLILSYLLPVKCFMYLHGNDLLCPLKNPVFRFLFRWTLTRCSGIVCNSQFTSDYLSKHFDIDTPLYVINPTVRLNKFGLTDGDGNLAETRRSIRQHYNIADSAVVILSVGRLVPRKGFDRVISALPKLLAEGVDVHYLVCGRGSLLPELQALAQSLNVAHRVHFAGFVPDERLAHYYATCDLFSLITYFDKKAASIEGFGIVYLEAGYFGKPVIAARVGGVTDAVKHDETGWLVNPDSSQEIAQILLRLCQDQSLRERLGRRGRDLASNPTPHRIIHQQLEAT